MKITREINGKQHEFTLTGEELIAAFYEQQAKFDRDDILMLVDSYEPGDFEYLGVTEQEYYSLADEMAGEMRRNIDKYDMDWSMARDEAIGTVVRRYKERGNTDETL